MRNCCLDHSKASRHCLTQKYSSSASNMWANPHSFSFVRNCWKVWKKMVWFQWRIHNALRSLGQPNWDVRGRFRGVGGRGAGKGACLRVVTSAWSLVGDFPALECRRNRFHPFFHNFSLNSPIATRGVKIKDAVWRWRKYTATSIWLTHPPLLLSSAAKLNIFSSLCNEMKQRKFKLHG